MLKTCPQLFAKHQLTAPARKARLPGDRKWLELSELARWAGSYRCFSDQYRESWPRKRENETRPFPLYSQPSNPLTKRANGHPD
jgi:hypothetical protein